MAKSFNRDMVAQSLVNRFGITKVKANEIVYHLQELIQQELYRGYPISLPMVGKFTPVVRKARTGRNPKTGEPVEIKEQHGVKFKASSKMKEWLNKNRK